ncbi:phosphatidylinositol transfer protein SFH5 [Aureobasidium pullulans]|uniref:Phosphatidylinositol transfer protein SFH5 n=1 Tax=Aureobasidium pullulans TaxID=5580 RepID=A0AB38LYL6_AURPU|nr:phosphatidylinositol transfer protein SFH5 [Aureobasidium pullulans]THZ44026.1 phosphatidylinositol transfer protein SFH5 [Aureobasidium pullulans]THZ75548.1 phosphatidylinositol transfer protein SFH5 [Aureobasidium pullulans]
MDSSLLSSDANRVNAAELNAKVNAAVLKSGSDWDDLPEGHVLLRFSAELGDIIKEAGYSEMYGIELSAPTAEGQAAPFHTLLILQKFLRANAGQVNAASSQLLGALKWRKEFKPLEVKKQVFDKTKFQGLGYVTRLKGVPESVNEEDVATFNIYGAVKDTKKTFGSLDEFIRWRVALMELTLETLNLPSTTHPIPDYNKGPDPHQALQIHDYLRVSFLRQPPEVKAASQKAIQLFSAHYPETLSKKYFVNVPLVMQWMFGAMQVFMAKETVRKMQWMSYGEELHKYLGASVGREYGGQGPELEGNSVTPRYEGESVGGDVDVDVDVNKAAREKEMGV